MKKLAILLSILLIASLCGCAGEKPCEHQWMDADCLTPKTCTVCSVTEGEALGHDFLAATCDSPESCSRCHAQQGLPLDHAWQSATCSAPETCTLCGSTQGEVLAHTYGKWEITGEEMSRSCTACGATETSAVDREVFAWEQITGHWDPYIISDGRSYYWATNLDMYDPGYCIRVSKDGYAYVEPGTGILEGYMTFVRYREEDGSYLFELDYGSAEPLVLLLFETEEEYQLLTVLDNMYIYFSQYEILTRYTGGTWASGSGGSIQTLTLREDGTFDYNGEFQGSWHLRFNLYDTTYYTYAILHYTQEGETMTIAMDIPLSINPDDPLEAIFYYPYTPYGYLYLNGENYTFTKADPEEIAQMEAALAEGRSKLPGSWNSILLETYYFNPYRHEGSISPDYTITFREDGTFTAQLDQERTGTWMFLDVVQSDSSITYNYELAYDNAPDVEYLQGYFRDGVFSLSESYDDFTADYTFRAEGSTLPQEVVDSLCTDWRSRTVSTYTYATGEQNDWKETGFHFTFREDGTVTGFAEKDRVGVWCYFWTRTLDYGEGNTSSQQIYYVQFDGDPVIYQVSILDGDYMSISFDDGNLSTSWHFSPN